MLVSQITTTSRLLVSQTSPSQAAIDSPELGSWLLWFSACILFGSWPPGSTQAVFHSHMKQKLCSTSVVVNMPTWLSHCAAVTMCCRQIKGQTCCTSEASSLLLSKLTAAKCFRTTETYAHEFCAFLHAKLTVTLWCKISWLLWFLISYCRYQVDWHDVVQDNMIVVWFVIIIIKMTVTTSCMISKVMCMTSVVVCMPSLTVTLWCRIPWLFSELLSAAPPVLIAHY